MEGLLDIQISISVTNDGKENLLEMKIEGQDSTIINSFLALDLAKKELEERLKNFVNQIIPQENRDNLTEKDFEDILKNVKN